MTSARAETVVAAQDNQPDETGRGRETVNKLQGADRNTTEELGMYVKQQAELAWKTLHRWAQYRDT